MHFFALNCRSGWICCPVLSSMLSTQSRRVHCFKHAVQPPEHVPFYGRAAQESMTRLQKLSSIHRLLYLDSKQCQADKVESSSLSRRRRRIRKRKPRMRSPSRKRRRQKQRL
ncbi:hypothetical protein ARMSODRAFT_1077436 [Armillaria solidipes]|uniref:Uncharacterized protein n=1 Tax=Armillaria solidipes TaxID=1076256 RepID=A0A2H3C3V5_9AGAR|nr:hypothetical protein ARMSODRAFT_1077436 [Armillaria solidipes]